MSLKIDAAVINHIGRRSNNEDNFFLNGLYMERNQMNLGGLYQTEFTQNNQVYAVCDGMGGAEFGEEASLCAVKRIGEYVKECEHPDSSAYIYQMINQASQEVDQISLSRGMPSGSCGSTIAMLTFGEWYFRSVHVGDSRIYLLRNGKLSRVTKDHSEVQCMIDAGTITPEQAWMHPKRNIITKHLGMPLGDRPLKPTVSPRLDLMVGDRFVICSDGLSDVVQDAVLAEILSARKSTKETCSQLAQLALYEADRYGLSSDNITIVLLDVKEIGSRRADERKLGRLKLLQKVFIGLTALIGCGIGFTIYKLIEQFLS